ncbi:hypothetical protein MTR_4g052080 [Medicago truncatula]|uniref:Uncharacterized protein n=1 Tax=Medicago truncatula TaxID=3880 RepID=G7JHA3_MEDTR|nr:hypothetical protein MTR_4g052080 [Medicago truncatula]
MRPHRTTIFPVPCLKTETSNRATIPNNRPIIAEQIPKYKVDSVEFEEHNLGIKVYSADEKELIMQLSMNSIIKKWSYLVDQTINRRKKEKVVDELLEILKVRAERNAKNGGLVRRENNGEKRALDSDSPKQESEIEDDCKQGSEEEEKIK